MKHSILRTALSFAVVLVCTTTRGAGAGYYVDSVNGRDTHSGISMESAWRSLDQLQKCSLSGADTLFFVRGSRFDGQFTVSRSGGERNPVVLTSCGDAKLPLPLFTNTADLTQDGYGNCIVVEADYVVVDHLAFCDTAAEIPLEHRISSFEQMWQLGAVRIDYSASHTVIRNCLFRNCGVGIKSNGSMVVIEHNTLVDCRRVLKEWSWGPVAIWLGGDHQTVRYNTIKNYRAEHPMMVWKNRVGDGADGGAIEIDDARTPKRHIAIYCNWSIDCQGFLEVTYKDVAVALDYGDFVVCDNLSDDYQQFVLLWRGHDCLFEHNTILRRKRNGNEHGVFRVAERNSHNRFDSNLIVTGDSVRIFWNNPHTDCIMGVNLFLPLDGRLLAGNSPLGEECIVIESLRQIGRYPQFGVRRLIDSVSSFPPPAWPDIGLLLND